jgi:hypothetical protein
MTKKSRNYDRDICIQERHRAYGADCPFTDLDAIEYDHNKAVLFSEWKFMSLPSKIKSLKSSFLATKRELISENGFLVTRDFVDQTTAILHNGVRRPMPFTVVWHTRDIQTIDLVNGNEAAKTQMLDFAKAGVAGSEPIVPKLIKGTGRMTFLNGHQCLRLTEYQYVAWLYFIRDRKLPLRLFKDMQLISHPDYDSYMEWRRGIRGKTGI